MRLPDEIQLAPRRCGVHTPPAALPHVRAAFFNSKSSSTTQIFDERIGASDEAVVVRGSGNLVDRSVTYQSTDQGAINAAAKMNADGQATAQAALKTASTLGVEAFDLAGGLGTALIDSLGEQRAKDQEIMRGAQQANANLAAATIDNVSKLSETRLTDGASLFTRTALWAGGGLLAAVLIGLWIFKRRS